MKPLFEVGEEVILVSVNNPHLNGEYIIDSLYSNGEKMVEYLNSSSFNITYVLVGIDGIAFIQSALRKKHKPSDFDFNELMKEINDLVTV